MAYPIDALAGRPLHKLRAKQASFSDPGNSIRRLLGELAADPQLTKYIDTIEPGVPLTQYPQGQVMERAASKAYQPVAGTDIGLIQPERLIARAIYEPHGLADAAARRLAESPFQSASGADEPSHWLYARPGVQTIPGALGRHIGASFPDGRYVNVYDIASAADRPLDILLHEVRHGLNQRQFLKSAAKRSLRTSDSLLNNKFQSYLSLPTEMLSHLAEAGDDYVRATGQLIESSPQVAKALDMWASSADASAGPNTRRFYRDAYYRNATARDAISDILKRYYAIPASGAAASYATQDDQ